MADRPLEVRYKNKKFRIGELADLIAELPKKLRAPVLRFAAEKYKDHFELYPRYKYVSRRRAYGNVSQDGAPPGYFSKRQFRYVMARIKDGTITPGRNNRTYETKNAWRIEGRGVNIAIVNDAPAAVHLFDPVFQARQPDMVGWETTDDMRMDAEEYVTGLVWDKVIELADDMFEKIMTGGKA